MNKTLTAAAITVVIVELIAFMQSRSLNGFDAQGFGFANIVCCALTFFVGLILLFIPNSKRVGEGVLLGTGILLLIGLFVCGTAGFL
jgi:hypothetical protein